MLPSSIFSNNRRFWRRVSILLGLTVTLVGLALAFFTWSLATRNEQDSVSTLKSFVENAILVSQKEGTLGTEDTLLRLGQISRPPKSDFFLFNGDHELIYSSRVEMNVGGNFSNWLVTPLSTLAAFVQGVPPGGAKHFPAVLQPIRGWKPKPGDAYISYIPGSSYYMLAVLEEPSRQDLVAAALRDLSWPAGLSVLFGFLTGLITWIGSNRHIKKQEVLWDLSTIRAVASINLAIKNRGKIQKNDVFCTEIQNFLNRLQPAEVYLASIAQSEALMASAEASARGLLNSINEIIFVVDQADEILWTNRRSEQFMEAPRSTLIGSPLPLYAGEPGLELTLKSGLAAAREGSGGSFLWSCRKINTGQVVPVEVWANKISIHGTDAICVSLRDISAQRKTEAELKRMVQDLQTALERGEVSVRSQGVFLARMSHEIRAPINLTSPRN